MYRGYVPVNVAEGHLREQYEMGEVLPEDDVERNSGNPLYGATPWLTDDEQGIHFRDLMMKHYVLHHDKYRDGVPEVDCNGTWSS